METARHASRAVGILLAALIALGGVASATAQESTGDIFPFPIHQHTLDNGFRVVVIPYDSPGTVAYLTVVRTGSREEVEPGHSGFAHFFEHMMFRGTERYSQDAYNDALKRLGADSNAFTTDDYTNYHIVAPSAALETLMDLESDRFRNLEYAEDDFKREALAVLGEYNKNASNPFLPMYERMRELAFTRHTYRHTTLGFLEDIQAMPGYFDYSLSFFDRFYRPENAILLIVGDVDPELAFPLAEKYYAPWEKGYQAPKIEAEPPQQGRLEGHVDWAGPIRPHLMMGYRVPAFSADTVDTAALDLASQLLFSESAPLYQRLVVEEQLVDFVSGSYSDHRDPYLFMVFSRLRDTADPEAVREMIESALEGLATAEISTERLDRIKSHLRYQFATALDSPGAVGGIIAGFLNLTGDPTTVNRVYENYAKVTADDIRRVAAAAFRPDNATVITLAHTPKTEAESEPESEDGDRDEDGDDGDGDGDGNEDGAGAEEGEGR